jgi:hypothetical protein
MERMSAAGRRMRRKCSAKERFQSFEGFTGFKVESKGKSKRRIDHWLKSLRRHRRSERCWDSSLCLTTGDVVIDRMTPSKIRKRHIRYKASTPTLKVI